MRIAHSGLLLAKWENMRAMLRGVEDESLHPYNIGLSPRISGDVSRVPPFFFLFRSVEFYPKLKRPRIRIGTYKQKELAERARLILEGHWVRELFNDDASVWKELKIDV